MTERNGYIHVPVESLQEITNFLTDHAQHLAAARQQHAAQDALQQRLAEAEKLLNSAELPDFAKSVVNEVAHQRGRWTSDHDSGKSPADWLRLIGYLEQKAMTAQMAGNTDKALHYCISTATALNNWHAAISGANSDMRLGIASPGDADSEKAPRPVVNLPRRKMKTEYSIAEEDAQAEAWNAALDAVQELNR